MGRIHKAIIISVATIAVSFLIEPFFPLGDWRWGLVAAALVLYLIIVTFLVERKQTLLEALKGAQCSWKLPRPIRSWSRGATRKAALHAPGNGIYIAKSILDARSVETAQEIFNIFEGASGKEQEAAPYAALAKILCRFDRLADATCVLRTMDDKGIAKADREEAKRRFLLDDQRSRSILT